MTINQREIQLGLATAILARNYQDVISHLNQGAYFDNFIRFVVPEYLLDIFDNLRSGSEGLDESAAFEVLDLNFLIDMTHLNDQAMAYYSRDYLKEILEQLLDTDVDPSYVDYISSKIWAILQKKSYALNTQSISEAIDNFDYGILNDNTNNIYRALMEFFNIPRLKISYLSTADIILNDNEDFSDEEQDYDELTQLAIPNNKIYLPGFLEFDIFAIA